MPRLNSHCCLIFLVAVALCPLLGCSGGKPTQGNFDKIKEGMTVKEVETLLGRATKALDLKDPRDVPEKIADTLGRDSRPDKGLLWMDGTTGYLVLFEDDKVIARASLTEAELAKSATREKLLTPGTLTSEKADQIKKGMSRAQVEGLLGPGSVVGKTAGRETLDWKENGKSITITFIKGRGAAYIFKKGL